jgi:hypothetical protein
MIFTKWNFNKKITDLIQYSDTPENASEELLHSCQALKIVKTISPVCKESFSEKTFLKSLEMAE